MRYLLLIASDEKTDIAYGTPEWDDQMVAYRALADAADCRWQQIQKWLRLGYVPTRRVAAISRATGIKPSRLNSVVGPFSRLPTLTGWGRWTDADVQAAKIRRRIG